MISVWREGRGVEGGLTCSTSQSSSPARSWEFVLMTSEGHFKEVASQLRPQTCDLRRRSRVASAGLLSTSAPLAWDYPRRRSGRTCCSAIRSSNPTTSSNTLPVTLGNTHTRALTRFTFSLSSCNDQTCKRNQSFSAL